MKKAERASEIPGVLRNGGWAVFAHEWADRDGITPDEWRDRVQAVCEDKNVPYTHLIILRVDITVVWNPKQEPDFEEIRESIEQVLRERWTQKD